MKMSGLLLVIVGILTKVCNGQELTMTLESEASYEGNPTTLSCSYTILDNTYELFDLEWFKGDSFTGPSTLKIADFWRAAASPSYYNGYDDSSQYLVSRDNDNSVSSFDILNVGFSNDRGRYWCRVTVRPIGGTGNVDEKASTDLIVYSPPDIPVISGSLTMTEDMATTLTCTADLGYPDDWYLAWSNEGTPIENQPDTTAVLSGTSQRFMFTSQLEFTPKRQDNTHFITCTASRALWTSTPLPEKTWGPINVQYEGNITNKHLTEVGIGGGLTANLTCIAKGNPEPTITWLDPDGVEIINGGNGNKYMVVESYTTSDTDLTIGNVTTSTLSIWAVDPQVDYGVYACNSNNGIGQADKHEIIVNKTRVPDQPTGVVLTDQTSSSLAVRWSAGYDGGETQWFHVSHKKTADSSETFSDMIEGGVTTYNVDGLESYTEYEIQVYAENDVGRNPSPGSILEYTLPGVPTSDSGFTLLFDSNEGTVKIDGLNANNGECIQLEVKREGISGWASCGDCIETNGTFTLSYWCLQTRKRRGRAIGDVEMVRAKLCQLTSQLCGDFINVMEPENTPVTNPPVSLTNGTAVGVTVGVVSIALIVVFALGLFFWSKKNKNRNGPAEEINLTTQRKHKGLEQKRYGLEGTAEYQEVADIVEPTDRTYANVLFKDKAFPRDMLKIIKELGHGAFGEVFLAEATGILKKSKVTLVAVKTLKEGASQSDKDDLLRELDLMKKLPDHKNVVRLMGFSVEQDPLYIIVEYLSKGNLKDLMKDSRVKGTRVYGNLHGASKSLSSGDLMKFANDVADGMHYISSQKCIHRDLAARNVLVAEDMTCKVSDFGLARDVIDNRVYERKSEGRLPLRWMALESILDEMYTTKSDVWSFGVLLWEIVTLGARPYPTMSAKLMLKQLRIGFRMPQPTHCQEELYEMMLKCWEEEPDRRPTFERIADELRQMRELDKDYIVINAYEETIYAVTIPDGEQEKC
ncbi:proto-oncogene tyrosine-protein kinase ROS-like isoform X2 [Asterias rubens]|uniref:proto-oncogene tyrosine-protein kinase ROS-like isoform X2 n=1 Tax=Asterias rubens TaxID=7604 RepID=UPI001455B52B|nr:proto-oncogene tyrosine-protein kinase ROS-like isoform X2 [Asterias rubens]